MKANLQQLNSHDTDYIFRDLMENFSITLPVRIDNNYLYWRSCIILNVTIGLITNRVFQLLVVKNMYLAIACTTNRIGFDFVLKIFLRIDD